jgi:two-component system, chemotaxis family, chemotaxis protein CheY
VTVPRVLVVDDDRLIRDLLVKIVERAGFACDTAADGAEAIALIERADSGPYGIILLDLMMPNVNGFEVIEHLKTSSPDLLRSVVVVTASPRVRDERIRREAIGGVIEKPFEVLELIRFLKESLAPAGDTPIHDDRSAE